MTGTPQYPPILFPPDPDKVEQPWTASNGVEYTWDPEKQSWILARDPEVTKDYVDYQDAFRVSRYGDSMINFLTLKSSFEDFALPIVGMSYKTSTREDKTTKYDAKIDIHTANPVIDFTEVEVASFRTKGTEWMTLGNSYINIRQKVKIISTANPFLTYDNNSNITILKNNSSKDVKVELKKSNSSRLSFTDGLSSFLEVNGDGQLKLKSDRSSNSLYIQRNTDAYDGVFEGKNTNTSRILSASPDSYIIQASSIYDKGLTEGQLMIRPAAGGDEKEVSFTSDANLITRGFFNKKKFQPGDTLAANSEAESQIGGMWKQGSTYYMRIS